MTNEMPPEPHYENSTATAIEHHDAAVARLKAEGVSCTVNVRLTPELARRAAQVAEEGTTPVTRIFARALIDFVRAYPADENGIRPEEFLIAAEALERSERLAGYVPCVVPPDVARGLRVIYGAGLNMAGVTAGIVLQALRSAE